MSIFWLKTTRAWQYSATLPFMMTQFWKLLSDPANLEVSDERGLTHLAWAVFSIEARVDVGVTPLNAAAMSGNLMVPESLAHTRLF